MPKKTTKKKAIKKKTKTPGKKKPSWQDLLDDTLKAAGEENGAQFLNSDGLAIKIRGVISTGCPSIDAAFGRGGAALGRLCIIHGKEGSGKTTLALHLVAECQQQGGIVVYIDKEYKLDPDYAEDIGVDTDKMIIVQPPYLERVFEICDGIIEKASAHREATGKRVPILIVLDSMNAAIAKVQYEGEYDAKHIAPQSRVFSNSLPKLMPKVSSEDVLLLFISQIRKKIGVVFGDDEEIAGGNAPRFYASSIVKVTRIGSVKEKKNFKTKEEEKRADIVASKIKVQVIKNQVAPPFRKAFCEIRYGEGIDKEASLADLALQDGIFKKSGAWYLYKDKSIGQGVAGVSEYLKKHPKFKEKILRRIRKRRKWDLVQKKK